MFGTTAQFTTGALIGQIGDMTFEIGTGTVIFSEGNGTLRVRINDADNGLHDNEGSLQVNIIK